MPVILFKTASKQLHEGYKAAIDRLSAGSSDSASGGKANFFSDPEQSRTGSFGSSSSEAKQTARRAKKFSILRETSREADGSDDSAPPSPRKADEGCSPRGGDAAASVHSNRYMTSLFASPTKKSSGSAGSIAEHTPPAGRAARHLRKTKSDRQFLGTAASSSSSVFRLGIHGGSRSFRAPSTASLDESEGGASTASSGLSALLSPQSSESGGTLSHISSIFQASLSSLKRGFDSQASGSIVDSSSEDEMVVEE